MKLCISNFGLDPNKPEEPGSCLEGNLRLVNDNSLFEQESKYCTGPKTCLNLILLDRITAADIARMAKNEEHVVHARICNNIISENLVPRNSVSLILTLTQMEKVVLSLMADNYTYRQIASILNIDYETAKSHGNNIHRKTGLRTNLQATHAFMAFKALHPEWRSELKESLRIFCP